jgi:hypothetical protein
MPIYYRCPDTERPYGGIRVIYRHVDILNRHGFEASVLHDQAPFRCAWFENETAIAYMRSQPSSSARFRLRVLRPGTRRSRSATRFGDTRVRAVGADDVLVVPEVMAWQERNRAAGVRVIFNQSGYLTFSGWPDAWEPMEDPYRDPTLRAVIVASETTEAYVRSAFPDLAVVRIHLSIDPELFAYQADKKPQIAFMPRRNAGHAKEVITLLKIRSALVGWDVVPLEGMTEAETASVLRDSAVFLSFGHPEGFGLPPAEAMRCGCVVIGYDGIGGREYFLPAHAFPIGFGDVLRYVETVEYVLGQLKNDSSSLRQMTKRASDFIASRYSPQREESDLLRFWRAIGPDRSIGTDRGAG